MRIIEVNDYRTFVSIKETWNDLLKKCDHTIFSTWELLSIWWKYFGKGRKLLILLAEENDRIIGIAPLMYSVYTMLGLRRGKIEFIGTPDTDYNNFIIAEKRNDCLNLFFNYLYTFIEKWDCIDLLDIPAEAECFQFIAKSSKSIKVVHRCPYIILPNSLDKFVSYIGSNKRHYLRNSLKKLEKLDPNVKFVNYSDNKLAKKGINILFNLHQKRWTQKGFLGVYSQEIMRNFHSELANLLSENGLLGLYSLEVSGKPISILYGFKYNKKFYFYLSGFEPEYFRYGPGNLLLFHVIGCCIQEGLKEFDFLRGTEEYKDRWKTNIRQNYQSIFIKKGAIAKIQHNLFNEYWFQVNRMKYVLKIKK